MTDKPKYVEIQPRRRDELETKLESSDPNAICDALYSAAQHEEDWLLVPNAVLKDAESRFVTGAFNGPDCIGRNRAVSGPPRSGDSLATDSPVRGRSSSWSVRRGRSRQH